MRLRVPAPAIVLSTLAVASGCARPEPAGEAAVFTDSAASSSRDPSSTTAATLATEGSGSEGGPPTRPLDELPAGCGDGLIVAGQFDCFRPIALGDITDEIGDWNQSVAFDIEGDGAEEILTSTGGAVRVLRWDGHGLVVEPKIDTEFEAYSLLEVSWDYDGDRRRDLLRLQRLAYVSGGVALHPNLAAAGLGQ